MGIKLPPNAHQRSVNPLLLVGWIGCLWVHPLINHWSIVVWMYILYMWHCVLRNIVGPLSVCCGLYIVIQWTWCPHSSGVLYYIVNTSAIVLCIGVSLIVWVVHVRYIDLDTHSNFNYVCINLHSCTCIWTKESLVARTQRSKYTNRIYTPTTEI